MKRAWIALFIAVVVTIIFSWPLAPHASRGIASSASNVEQGNVRRMIAGDHLQFLYHMWLGQDTFTGNTPLFYNLYEFNRGDDEERYEVRPYYLPFSLFFTVGSLIGGRAVGWNLAIVISMWLTYWVLWRLVYRYARDEWIAAILAVLAIAIPYPWITLLGGSPTGFGMLWVPVLLYGLDVWIGDRRFHGALLAGSAIFFAEWSDTHVFFFNVLISPFWAAFVYFYRYGWCWPKGKVWLGWLKSGWILVVFFVLTFLRAWIIHRSMGEGTIADGRSMHEIALFSHGLEYLFKLSPSGDGSKIYVGLYLVALLGLSAGVALWRIIRRNRVGDSVALVIGVLGVGGLFVLSTGVENPLGPRAWGWLTRLIPPYGMIRQPDKIFCLLPALLAVAGALLWCVVRPSSQSRLWPWRLGVFALVLPLLIDYQYRLNPTVCLLDDEQGAYAAVKADADAADIQPLVLVLPLWPGDSHYASLYQHYVSLYRLRMVNGYRPTARAKYVESIFRPYESMNLGYPTDAQLDGLLELGVTHLILHEDAFPEKVSSFPVGVTLANLMRHPRLKPLDQDGAVWSFRILAEPDGRGVVNWPEVPAWFPVRVWNWGDSDLPEGVYVERDDAYGREVAVLDSTIDETVGSRWIRTSGPIPMEWHLRVKGSGTFEIAMVAGTNTYSATLAVVGDEWQWVKVRVPDVHLLAEQTASVNVLEGEVAFDSIILLGEGWEAPSPGGAVSIPAIAMFHAGYSLPDGSGVRLRQDNDPDAVIVYGRHLYLESGDYRITLDYETDAEPGTLLGHLQMRADAVPGTERSAAVIAGQPGVLLYTHPDSRFFKIGFDYSREADVVIHQLTLEKMNAD